MWPKYAKKNNFIKIGPHVWSVQQTPDMNPKTTFLDLGDLKNGFIHRNYDIDFFTHYITFFIICICENEKHKYRITSTSAS